MKIKIKDKIINILTLRSNLAEQQILYCRIEVESGINSGNDGRLWKTELAEVKECIDTMCEVITDEEL